MDKSEFWKYVTDYRGNGRGSGWEGIQNQIRAVVKSTFPNVDTFDWDWIELAAVKAAMRNYDPSKSQVSTWICWWAKGAASKWIKRSIKDPEPIPFCDIGEEDDDEQAIENLAFCLDKHCELSPSQLQFLDNTLRTDLSIMTGHRGIIGYTAADLISDTLDGMNPSEMGRKAGVSRHTIERAAEETGKRLKEMGIKDEIMARVSEQDKLPGGFAVQDVSGTQQVP